MLQKMVYEAAMNMSNKMCMIERLALRNVLENLYPVPLFY